MGYLCEREITISLFAMIQKSDYIQITGIRSKNIPPDPWERGFSVKGY